MINSPFRGLMIAGVIALASLPIAAWAQDDPAQITVTGQGSAQVVPDIALITIGVSNRDESAALALAGMTDGLTGVFARLSAEGVDPADMQTGLMRLSRQYDSGILSSGSSPDGFEATSTVTVRMRDLDGLGGILDAVVRDGANTLNGLQFDVSDRAPYVRAARIAAVADARLAAETLATAAGLALGEVVVMQEGAGRSNQPMLAEMSMARGGDVPIAAGEISVLQSVTIVYTLVAKD
ncbi:SIMPL domain-containing protein [Yoonia sp. 208BN28-4]|uniref:SIMPL domain-containing protein n=1 Tax=Yoonia sp. 208BN28-4 TaxID=3126505 RepID=UPI003095002F